MRPNDFQEILNETTDSGRVALGKQLIEHLLLMENGLARLILICIRQFSEEEMLEVNKQLAYAKERINK